MFLGGWLQPEGLSAIPKRVVGHSFTYEKGGWPTF